MGCIDGGDESIDGTALLDGCELGNSDGNDVGSGSLGRKAFCSRVSKTGRVGLSTGLLDGLFSKVGSLLTEGANEGDIDGTAVGLSTCWRIISRTGRVGGLLVDVGVA